MQPDYQTQQRMELKLQAIPLPDLSGKSVLDVGCDMRYWCNLALDRGASRVVGVDRGRESNGNGFINMADHAVDVGKQWREFGQFDVIFLFSLYHHIYQSAGGDHLPIWYWLRRHMKEGGELLWENPLSLQDPVADMHIAKEYRAGYTPVSILEAATQYFNAEHLGPAIHVPTRDVYRFKPCEMKTRTIRGTITSGAGGASKAFQYADGRRMDEIEKIVGIRPFPGSLNVILDENFSWIRNYYRAQVLDVNSRRMGLEAEWSPRWARFYPILVNDVPAVGFRFEGEVYQLNFLELIAPYRLRDKIQGVKVEIQC